MLVCWWLLHGSDDACLPAEPWLNDLWHRAHLCCMVMVAPAVFQGRILHMPGPQEVLCALFTTPPFWLVSALYHELIVHGLVTQQALPITMLLIDL